MSNPSWMVLLKQAIKQTNDPVRCIAVVGVGHELRGDDAAGVMVARRLQPAPVEHWLVIDAGPAPENFTGILRKFDPDSLILVDALLMNEAPGTIRLLNIESAQRSSATTHALSLHLLGDYLQATLDCEILLLGIQPEQDRLGTGLSDAVRQSVDQVVHGLQAICGWE